MIAVVAIVVIGPKDLPRTLRTIGQWIGKARAVTRDLQNSVNDMIADSEIEELRKAGSSMGDFGTFGSGEPMIIRPCRPRRRNGHRMRERVMVRVMPGRETPLQ